MGPIRSIIENAYPRQEENLCTLRDFYVYRFYRKVHDSFLHSRHNFMYNFASFKYICYALKSIFFTNPTNKVSFF